MTVLGLTGWLELLNGILQFPGQILGLVRILKKTPLERHQELLSSMAKEAEAFQETGRPTWPT